MKATRWLAVLAAMTVVGSLAAAAGAEPNASRTISLNWSEAATAGGRTLMTLRVKRLVIEDDRWTLHASFTNRSAKTLRIQRRFALLLADSRKSKTHTARRAKGFTPPMPTSLPPGTTWSGTWRGDGAGALRRDRFLRVHFDHFLAAGLIPGQPGFGWITDHAKRL